MPKISFEGAHYSVQEGESVLDAMLRGGANLSFSCRKGSCQACLLRVKSGDPGIRATRGLRPAMREKGYFLPCQARPSCDLKVERADLSELFVKARVESRDELAPGVVRLRLEPETNLMWRAGQLMNVKGPGGAVRSYSIASIPEHDYYLELHVKLVPGGVVSGFLARGVEAGDEIEVQGPQGGVYYESGREDQPLLLVGTGTGLAPLWGIARDALALGHRGPVTLVHGTREASGLYLDKALRALAEKYANFRYVPCVSGPGEAPSAERGRASDVARAMFPDLSAHRLFIAGRPEMVYDLRARAIAAGAERSDVLADAFESGPPFMPNDGQKLASIAPDPELWEALDRGPKLTEILTEFYGHVFEDPRLAPFFHKVTKERAIEKQYAFLRDVFSGEKGYFGLRPFNAHHWMVISDELFDYRERLFEQVLRRHNIADHLVRRWLGMHEMFRREIVKSSPRGLVIDGRELPIPGYEELEIEVGAMCDGCQGEIPRGAKARCHLRTGELFCQACLATKSMTTRPPPPPSPPSP